MLNRFLLLLIIFTIPRAYVALAEPIESNPNYKMKIEVGASAGFPAFLNLRLGVWHPNALPIAFRASGMHFSQDLNGFDFQVAWPFDSDGQFQQFLGLTVGTFVWDIFSESQYSNRDAYLSPTYGFYLADIISIEAGFMFWAQNSSYLEFFPMAKVGLGYRF